MDMNKPPAITQPYPTELGSSYPWTTGSFSLGNIKGPTYFILGGANGELVRISMQDGSVTFGPAYNPDEAARTFWQAISEDYRRMLRWKAEHPDEVQR